MIALTAQQAKCKVFIADHLDAHGIAPSYDQMCGALGLSSKSAVHRLIEALVERGHIRRLAKRARALEIIEPSCPHCGGVLSKPPAPRLRAPVLNQVRHIAPSKSLSHSAEAR